MPKWPKCNLNAPQGRQASAGTHWGTHDSGCPWPQRRYGNLNVPDGMQATAGNILGGVRYEASGRPGTSAGDVYGQNGKASI